MDGNDAVPTQSRRRPLKVLPTAVVAARVSACSRSLSLSFSLGRHVFDGLWDSESRRTCRWKRLTNIVEHRHCRRAGDAAAAAPSAISRTQTLPSSSWSPPPPLPHRTLVFDGNARPRQFALFKPGTGQRVGRGARRYDVTLPELQSGG